VDRLLVALLADGHLLVGGAPGLAKTSAIKALAARIEGDFHRLQFTPDLLPADLTGTEVYWPADGSFRFDREPIFHNLLLADEVNRAPAKVQSDAVWRAPWLALVFALAWLTTLLLWLWERCARGGPAAGGDAVAAHLPSTAQWVSRLRRACERNDAKSARRALAGWAGPHPAADGQRGIVAVLRERGAGVAALALVEEMDRQVYAPDGTMGGSWNGAALLAAVGPVLESPPGFGESARTPDLPPLFPGPGNGRLTAAGSLHPCRNLGRL
jgi:hypothetical protein